jgi:hypothetical protein
MPEDRIFADPRAPEQWQAILDDYQVKFLVLDILQDGELLKSVSSDPGWTVDFQDAENVLLARSGIAA